MRCERCGVEIKGDDVCPSCGYTAKGSRGRIDWISWLGPVGFVCIVAFLVGVQSGSVVFVYLGVAGAVLVLTAVGRADTKVKRARMAGDIDVMNAARRSGSIQGYGCVAALVIAVFVVFSPFTDRLTRERAKQSISLSHIKQLAVGVMTYSQDYQETFPGWVRNPDGQYAHNCWDEQISNSIKSKDVFNSLPNSGRGIRCYSQKGTQDRVVTYGLNGLLNTPAQARVDGNADFGAVNAKHPPEPLSPSAMADPAGTILFAELATDAPMAGVYGQEPEPKPYTYIPRETSKQWQGAWPGWIDISPRAFVETGKGAGSYREPYTDGATDRGVARDLYGGGGVYAFCDGHVQFMKISKSVGIGTMVNNKTVTVDNCWEPWNTNNMWNPD